MKPGIEQKAEFGEASLQMNSFTVFKLPTKRPFNWRLLWILVSLQLAGNLASIPLLRFSAQQVESLNDWIFWTTLSVPVIGIGIKLGGQIGLGTPLLEGLLSGHKLSAWLRSAVGLALIITMIASIPLLLVNRNIDPAGYPAAWMLILASIDAGVQEEIFSRLFLMTLIAWAGSLIWRDSDGRPAPGVMWFAVGLSGFIFGLGHIDNVPITLENSSSLVTVFLLSALLGGVFGWLYWHLGLESAIGAHFMVDAMYSGIVIPAYLSHNFWVHAVTIGGLILLTMVSLRLLRVQSPVT